MRDRVRPADSRDMIAGTDQSGGESLEPTGADGVSDLTEVDRASLTVHASFEYFQGPIPSPQVVSDYERAMPGAAERIFALAERQAAHRQRIEARGQMLGFVVAMTAVVGGLGLIILDKSLAGAAGAIAALVGLAGLFAWSRARAKDRTLTRRGSDGT